MYQNILIPTDGSEGSRRGAEHGLDIAKQYDATVHVVYVVDERIVGGTSALSTSELFFEQCEERGEEMMDEIVEMAKEKGLETTCSCLRGIPYERILEYAGKNDIDLIVMGIHGRGRKRRRRPHIGSVTDRVVRAADVPVLPV